MHARAAPIRKLAQNMSTPFKIKSYGVPSHSPQPGKGVRRSPQQRGDSALAERHPVPSPQRRDPPPNMEPSAPHPPALAAALPTCRTLAEHLTLGRPVADPPCPTVGRRGAKGRGKPRSPPRAGSAQTALCPGRSSPELHFPESPQAPPPGGGQCGRSSAVVIY